MKITSTFFALTSFYAGCSASGLRGQHRNLQQTTTTKVPTGKTVRIKCLNGYPYGTGNQCSYTSSEWTDIKADSVFGDLVGCTTVPNCKVTCNLSCSVVQGGGSRGGVAPGNVGQVGVSIKPGSNSVGGASVGNGVGAGGAGPVTVNVRAGSGSSSVNSGVGAGAAGPIKVTINGGGNNAGGASIGSGGGTSGGNPWRGPYAPTPSQRKYGSKNSKSSRGGP